MLDIFCIYVKIDNLVPYLVYIALNENKIYAKGCLRPICFNQNSKTLKDLYLCKFLRLNDLP